METDVPTPTFDPQMIRAIIFSYWGRDDDIACIHINERRSAFTLEVDGGVYLREDGGNVVGIEVHGVSRAFAGSKTLSRVSIPALTELKAFAGRTLDESFEVRGTAEELPRTTQMLIFVIAHALATHEAELRAEHAGAAHRRPVAGS